MGETSHRPIPDRHPLSECWGTMAMPEQTELRKDIQEHGIREPVVWLDSQILDGWHRTIAGITALMMLEREHGDLPADPAIKRIIESIETGLDGRTFDPEADGTPLDFVISANARRRHDTPEQLAAKAVKAAQIAGTLADQGGNRSKPPIGGLNTSTSIAEATGASVRNVERVRSASKESPELVDAVADGKMTPHAAQKEAKRRKDARQAAATEGLESASDDLAEALDDAAKSAVESAGSTAPEDPGYQIAEASAASLEDQLEEAKERLKLLEDSASPEAAGRLQALNAKQEENRVLRSQLHNWQVKYEDQRRQAEASKKKMPPVVHHTGDEEWYTPSGIVELARKAMGSIDLDPASCEVAQKTVKAGRFHSKDDSGLDHDWSGNVYINPPYTTGLVDKFIHKAIASYKAGSVSQVVILLNAIIDTKYGQDLQKASSAVCFPAGRVKFVSPNRKANSATQGQMICYLGSDVDSFAKQFSSLGVVWVDRYEEVQS